jgi:hypothetical protein
MGEFGKQEGVESIAGTALTPTIIIIVHWPWVTLIALQVVTMWIALHSVLRQRGRTVIIKGSMIAMLHILDRLPSEPGGVNDLNSMEKGLTTRNFRLEQRYGACSTRSGWFLGSVQARPEARRRGFSWPQIPTHRKIYEQNSAELSSDFSKQGWAWAGRLRGDVAAYAYASPAGCTNSACSWPL